MGIAGQAPKQADDIYVTFPLGTPLPYVGDTLWMNNTFYIIKNRALMLTNDAYRDAFWNLLVEQTVQKNVF
jgi:hypothetical protein